MSEEGKYHEKAEKVEQVKGSPRGLQFKPKEKDI